MRPIGPSAPMSMDSAAQRMLARFLSIVHSIYGVRWARCIGQQSQSPSLWSLMRSCGVLQCIGRILETTGTKRAGGCIRLMTPGRRHACRTWFTPPTYWSCQVSSMKWPIDHMGCWKSHRVTFAMFEQRCCPQGSICLSGKSSSRHFVGVDGLWCGVLAPTIESPWLMSSKTAIMGFLFKLRSQELSLPMQWTSPGGVVNRDSSCIWTISTTRAIPTSSWWVSPTG